VAKSIDIRTTQNVTIAYEMASLMNRIIAWFIDLVIIVVAIIVISMLTNLITSSGDAMILVAGLIIVPLFFFYTLIWEWSTSGATPGKMAMRLQVVRLDGKPLSFMDHVLRWSFRMVDIYFSLGAMAIVLINLSDYAQRLGDLMSNTTVIRKSSSLSVDLNDILKIKSLDNYEPKYPDVKKLDEEDMLLIKRVIERYLKHRNPAHRQSIELAAQKMAKFLGLNDVPDQPEKFLNTCIRDYIVLTR